MLTPIIQKFKNDYNHTCHPAMLEALSASAADNHEGYGLDGISQRTADLLRKHCHCPQAHVHFLPGGTLTNLLTISAFLRPHQAIIAAESGHINVHETGAIEATGHKVLTAPSEHGKLCATSIEKLYAEHDNEHMVQAKLVYISQSTELGTVYSKKELEALSACCKKLGLYLFVDGARIGSALMQQNAPEAPPSLQDIAQLCDAFYMGGTKNGALFGEALLLINTKVQEDFRYLCKQRGAMLAKGWLVAAQFEAFFQDSLYYDLAKHGNIMAQQLDAALKHMQIPLLAPTKTNQIFPILPLSVVKELEKSYGFELWARHEDSATIRFVTSWNTNAEDVEKLAEHLKTLL